MEICEELSQFEEWAGFAKVYEDGKVVGVMIGDQELVEAILDAHLEEKEPDGRETH
jgi:glutaredoxin-related protein